MSDPISYTLRGAADKASVSTSTLRGAIAAGALRVKRTGPNGTGLILIPHTALLAWLESLEDG